MARDIRIPNRKDYDKYLKEVKDKGWNDQDFKDALDYCNEDLISKMSNRSTIISILKQNSLLTADDQAEIEMEKTTDRTKNTVLLEKIGKKDIVPCLPLLLATMDKCGMSNLSKLILAELTQSETNEIGNTETLERQSKEHSVVGNDGAPGNCEALPKATAISAKLTIQKNLSYLTENMSDITAICIALVSEGLLSMNEKEKIIKAGSQLEQSDQMFNILLRKDLDKNDGLAKLISAFKTSGNDDLADRLLGK